MNSVIERLCNQQEPEVYQGEGWNPEHVFIDALELYAERPSGWPDIYSEEVRRTDENGSVSVGYRHKRIGPKGKSYGIKVAMDQVFVDINPASVERPENVFGYRLGDSLQRVSDLLARHGCRGSVDWKVTRLDLTANVATGSPQSLKEYLQQNRYIELPHCEKHVSRYGSVAWHNNAKRLHVYDKAAELDHKQKQQVPEDAISWLRHQKEQDDYMESVVSGLRAQGVARVELKLKKAALESRGIRVLENITQERLDEIFMKEVSVLKKLVLDNGAELSDAELGVLVRWMQGEQPRERMHRNTFSKYRKNIREATGYDIASPGPVSIERRKKKKFGTRTIGPADIAGYVLPTVEDLA